MTATDAPHLRELVAAGRVRPLPVRVSREFADYLESCPLRPPLGDAIDWSRMPKRCETDWYAKTDGELVAWARNLRLGRCSHVAVWYGPDQPSLLTDFEYGVANLDVLTWTAPGPRYLFGVDETDGALEYRFDALLEVTGGTALRGVA